MPKPQSALRKAERRVWVRRSCDLDSACQPVPLPTASQPEMQWHARVRNVSVGGLNLVLRRRFEIGTSLFIDIPTVEDRRTKTLAAVVVHVVRGPNGWVHGCQFDMRLTQDDLLELF